MKVKETPGLKLNDILCIESNNNAALIVEKLNKDELKSLKNNSNILLGDDKAAIINKIKNGELHLVQNSTSDVMQAAVKFIEKPVTPELGKNGEPIEHQYLKADTSMLRRNQDILNNASKDGGIPDNANKSGASVGGETEGAQTSAQPDDSGVEYNKDLGGKADKEVSDSDSAGKNKEAEKEVAAKPKEDEKKEEPEDDERKCDTCGKAYNEDCIYNTTDTKGKGIYTRSGYKIKKNIIGAVIIDDDDDKDFTVPKHKYSTSKNTAQIHHIIDCAAAHGSIKDLIVKMDYDINNLQNLVVLPSSIDKACELAVPLHRSNHGAGSGFTLLEDKSKVASVEFDKLLKIEDDLLKNDLEKLEENGIDKAEFNKLRDKYKSLEDKFLTYPIAVKSELKQIEQLIDEEGLCHNDTGNSINEEEIKKEFKLKMDKTSKKILERISNFTWTLTKDGRDYAPGNPCGCSNITSLTDKDIKIKRFAHCSNDQHKDNGQRTINITELEIGK